MSKPSIQTSEASTQLAFDQILPFFLPMAGSWLIMALEAPVVTVFMAKLPHPNASIAGFGLVATLSFVVETPVLGLLSTATALSINRQHFIMMRSFAFAMMALVTVCAAALILTPLYDFITRNLLGVPSEVRELARQGLLIMIPWSAGVGLRRYAQGLLIRNGITRPMTLGTLIRLMTMALVSAFMYSSVSCSGVQLGATAWVSGVWAEAIFIQMVSRGTVREVLRSSANENTPPLRLRGLIAYHFPLTLANLLWLMARPLYVWGLSAAPSPTLKLAGLEASNQCLFLFRAPAFAMPEAVIALSVRDKRGEALKKFSVMCGMAMALSQLFACASGMLALLYIRVMHVPEETAFRAIIILIISTPVAFLACYQGYLKGRLSFLRKTSGLTWSIFVHVVTLAILIPILVRARMIGIETIALALVLATCIETVYLQKILASHSKDDAHPPNREESAFQIAIESTLQQ